MSFFFYFKKTPFSAVLTTDHLLLEDGFGLLLEDGTSFLLL